ncbi:MAG TPA: enoyl-CoA hydratase/isomerase family protein [Conexibacter sp.]
MSDEPAVAVEQSGAVRRLLLNRPAQRNAIDGRLLAELDAAVAAAGADDDVAVVVLAGRGPSFCAGADLRQLLSLDGQPGEPVAWIAEISAAITRLERCPKPVVAALHGHVVAGGLELALACDAVIAAEGTLIGDGHVRNGLLPGGGSSVRLSRAVGTPLARWLMLSGELLPVERFLAAGWLHAVVPAERLDEEALALAERLAAAAGPAQHAIKALLAELDELTPAAGLAAELRAFDANWSAADVPAALEAFFAARSTSTS